MGSSSSRLEAQGIPPHQYDALSDPQSIRLLRFLPTQSDPQAFYGRLETFKLSECPSFHALSYTWGRAISDPNIDDSKSNDVVFYKVFILGPGSEDDGPEKEKVISYLDVNENLFQGLHRVAQTRFDQSQEMYLWVDAMCINQNDEKERSAQVLLMGSIYSQALEVIVWLGERIDKVDDDFIFIVREISPFLERLWLDHGEGWFSKQDLYDPAFWEEYTSLRFSRAEWIELWKNLLHFCSRRRWFKRAWVVQEVTLSRNCTVLLGNNGLNWFRIVGLNRYFLDEHFLFHVPSDGSISVEGMSRLQNMKILGWIYKKSIKKPNEAPPWSGPEAVFYETSTAEEWWYAMLFDLISQLRSFHASDDRDKIYAIFGLATKVLPPHVINPLTTSYLKTAEDVYIEITSMLLRHRPRLSILSEANNGFKRYNNLPSWVPDYSYEPTSSRGLNRELPRKRWDASLCRDYKRSKRGKRGRRPLVEVDGNILKLSGASVDIVLTKMEFDDKSPLGFMRYLMKINTAIGEIYKPTNESAFEATWQTLLLGCGVGTNINSEMDLPRALKDAILFLLAVEAGQHELQTETKATNEWILHTLLDPLSSFPGFKNWLPTVNDIQYHKDAYVHSEHNVNEKFDVGDSERWFTYQDLRGIGRYFFISKQGYIGMATQSTSVGDEIWLLKGGIVPFTLRKNGGDRTYSLLGDVYVHGAMHGELAGILETDTRTVEIV